MFVRTPKIVCCRGKQKTRNSTFLRRDGKQPGTLDEQHHCVSGGFDRQAMLSIAPAEKIAGEIERDNVAAAIFESLAVANDPTHHQKQIVGGVAFAGNNVVPVKTDRTPLKGGECSLKGALVAEGVGKIGAGVISLSFD